MLTLDDVHQAPTRTKAYDLCDEYLARSYIDEGLTDEAYHTLAAYLSDSTRNYRAKVVGCMADRECTVMAPLMGVLRSLLHDENAELRRMACLALRFGGDEALRSLRSEWHKLTVDQRNDFTALLRLVFA